MDLQELDALYRFFAQREKKMVGSYMERGCIVGIFVDFKDDLLLRADLKGRRKIGNTLVEGGQCKMQPVLQKRTGKGKIPLGIGVFAQDLADVPFLTDIEGHFDVGKPRFGKRVEHITIDCCAPEFTGG